MYNENNGNTKLKIPVKIHRTEFTIKVPVVIPMEYFLQLAVRFLGT